MTQIQLLGFFALMITYLACGQTPAEEVSTEVQSETPENWKLLEKPEYAIQYPDSFDLDTSGQMGMRFMLLSKQISEQDVFRENVNLVVQNLPGEGVDLDRYTEISLGQIETMITDVNLLESKKITNKNKSFQRMIYTGKQGQYDLKWQQRYWVENKKAYVLTLTCEVDQYDKYVSIGEEIMNTFRIK